MTGLSSSEGGARRLPRSRASEALGHPPPPPEVENRSSNPAAQTTLLLREGLPDLGGDDPRSADLGGVSAALGREPSGAEGAAEGAAVARGSVSHGGGTQGTRSHSPR